MSVQRNPFQGVIVVNGKHYLARDIFDALIQQGLVVDFDDTGLIVGFKKIAPLTSETLQAKIERGELNPMAVAGVLSCNCGEKIGQLQETVQHLLNLVNQVVLMLGQSLPPSNVGSSTTVRITERQQDGSARFREQLSQVRPSFPDSTVPRFSSTTSFGPSRSTTSSVPFPPSQGQHRAARTIPSKSSSSEGSENPWQLLDKFLPSPVPPVRPSENASIADSRHPRENELGMQSPTPPVSFPTLRCHSCRNPLPPGSLFCSKCGAKVRT